MPKISVVMPAYNAGKYIAQAIDSILGQTFEDFEFIIINDCSTDDTEKIIASYRDKRILYRKNPRNLGVAETLNRGLEIAKGEYIARMDADDISLPERFVKQTAFLDAHPEVAVLGTGLEVFNSRGTVSTGWSSTDCRQMKVDLLFACGLAHPSVMMRRSVILGLGGYDAEFEGLEDYELWCRVAREHGVTTLPDVLLRYRLHDAQVTRHPSARQDARMRMLKIRQLEELGIDPECTEADAFYHYCTGEKPRTREQVEALSGFFELALRKNAECGCYDANILSGTFRSVLIPAVAKLPKTERQAAAAGSSLIDAGQVRRHRIKQTVKKIIGRK